MDLVENRGKLNKVIVNKKKSGILILNRRAYGEDDNIRGYPLKNWYKYLGIAMNYNLDPTNHLYVINRKISEYLVKNRWLMKTYFSPKTLILLANYFQMSRLSYGMCTYLDNGKNKK